jgi:superfamily I DNA/RNA helicase
MEWMVGVAQLDAVQRRTIDAIINAPAQNHWIKGFAGTGKTIVLTHVLKRLAAERGVKTCFATYTHALREMVESGLTSKEIKEIESTTFSSIGKLRGGFDVLVADEFQDIPKKSLETVLRKADSLVIAADHAQRIYRFSAKEDELSRAIRPAKEHKLRTIHRINLPVYTVATTIFPDAEFSPGEAPDDDREPVQIMSSNTRAAESKAVLAEASRLAKAGSPSAILVPSNAHLTAFLEDIASASRWGKVPPIRDNEDWDDPFGAVNEFLARHKSPVQLFGSKSGSITDSDSAKTVYLMTYHNAKGLEFPYVFMPYLTEETSLEPMKYASIEQESRIFFVAATRAKERLHLSYHGEPHMFIETLRELDDDVITEFTTGKRRY